MMTNLKYFSFQQEREQSNKPIYNYDEKSPILPNPARKGTEQHQSNKSPAKEQQQKGNKSLAKEQSQQTTSLQQGSSNNTTTSLQHA